MASLPSKRLVFREKQRVECESCELEDPGPGEVLVRVGHSLMSTGTENIVFNQLYAPGTHWDHWVKFPFYPGYAAAGVVAAVGEGVESPQPGERVAVRCPHGAHALVKAESCYPVPDSVPLEQAVWFALAKIAFQGRCAAEYRAGDDVAVIGAGPIGQMSLRWARANGAARVVVIDPVPERERFAQAGGAHAYFAAPADKAKPGVEAALGGLPRVVVDSTGHAAVFAAALGLAAQKGHVVVLGDTGHPAEQHLTSDVIMKGLTIAGAHDGTKFTGWDEPSAVRYFFQLVEDGRFPLGELNTHRFGPGEAAEAYATANRERAQTMGLIFDWNE
ncbi:MAG: zinc-binding alcohol dehydrogenase [Verrucomicrobiota bacterium]